MAIYGNVWFRHSEQVGGDAIDFVRHFYGLDFEQAVEELFGNNHLKIMDRVLYQPEAKREFILPSRNFVTKRVERYLVDDRGIDSDIVRFFIDQGTLYEDSQYHNCVFVGEDENGVPRMAHKLSSYLSSGFRQDVEGSDKRYGFKWIGTSGEVFVFEAPIDMLSYISIHPDNWQDYSYLALGGTSPKALYHLLAVNDSVNRVTLCLDNDKPGNEAAIKIALELREQLYPAKIMHPPVCEDWNEELQAVQKEPDCSLTM